MDSEFYVEYDQENGLNLFNYAMTQNFYNEFGIELSNYVFLRLFIVSFVLYLSLLF